MTIDEAIERQQELLVVHQDNRVDQAAIQLGIEALERMGLLKKLLKQGEIELVLDSIKALLPSEEDK